MSLGDDMPAPYSGDLRRRVAAAVAEGAPARSAAGRFEVSVSTAIRWAQLARGRSCRVAGDGGDHRSRLLEHRPAVLELLARQPDLTLPGSRHRTGRIAR